MRDAGRGDLPRSTDQKQPYSAGTANRCVSAQTSNGITTTSSTDQLRKEFRVAQRRKETSDIGRTAGCPQRNNERTVIESTRDRIQ